MREERKSQETGNFLIRENKERQSSVSVEDHQREGRRGDEAETKLRDEQNFTPPRITFTQSGRK